jgi:uncharacterized metal-binding protein
MPDGRTHTSVTVLTSIYASVFLLDRVTSGSFPLESTAVIVGCLSGVVLTPDLDVDGGNVGFSIIRRRAGSLPAFLWRAYWFPYSRLIPHRHWVSHLPLVSTAIRLTYLFWWIPLVPVTSWLWTAFLWFAVGLALADFNHAFLDFVRPDDDGGVL